MQTKIELVDTIQITVKQGTCDFPSNILTNIFNWINPITISLSIILFAISILYSNRPKLDDEIVFSYIDAKKHQRVNQYKCKIWWGWKKFPWQYIPKSRRLGRIQVPTDTEVKYYYNPRIDDERPLSDSCIIEKSLSDKKIISFKDKSFFHRECIKDFYIKTYDNIGSSFEQKIATKFYMTRDDPTTIKIINSNSTSIRNYSCVLDPTQTANILTRIKNVEDYIEMINAGVVSECKITNNEMNITINSIPQRVENVDGITIISLS